MDEINVGNQNNKPPQASNTKIAIGVIIAVIIIIGAILFAVIISSVGSLNSYLSYENYMKIHTGMTYNEVVNVLDGHRGELSNSAGYGDYTLSYYTWSNSSGTRCIVIGFENGKVCAKSQYGLN